MANKKNMVSDAADSPFEEDDTMERDLQVESDQKLPLHPVLADDEDVQDGALDGDLANKDVESEGGYLPNQPMQLQGDLIADADNTETSSVAAVGSIDVDADIENMAAEAAGSKESADRKFGSANPIPSFPLPDLREREDGGAIDFDEEEPAPSKVSQTKVSEEVRSKSRAEFTTVYDIIDAMEATLMGAKNVLFAAGMVKIDRDEFADQLSRLKDMLPVQLERASALMREAERRLRTAQTQANSIVASAQSQSAEIIEEAQERAQFLAGQENVTALAKQKARNILATAQAKSDKLTQGADQYCATVMEGLKAQLDKLEQDVQAGQRVLEDRRRAAAHVQSDISASLYEDDDDDERN